MFNKTKNKLKYKLIKWLEIEQSQHNLKNNIKNCENLTKDNWEATERNFNGLSKRVTNTYSEQQEQIDALNKTLQSVISLGTDVDSRPSQGSKSWAVVCIEGRYNIVKFIDLQGQDFRGILDYLKQFECSRRVIDTPYKQMFEENFVWFNDDK